MACIWVIFDGWSAKDIIVVYALELVVIGVINFFKIWFGDNPATATPTVTINGVDRKAGRMGMLLVLVAVKTGIDVLTQLRERGEGGFVKIIPHDKE